MSDLTDVLHWLRQSLVVIKEQQAENKRLRGAFEVIGDVAHEAMRQEGGEV